jgi:cytoskeleton protein RodZ
MAAFGDTLRQARAHKGVSLIEAAQATYINRFYLVALEEENFGALPDGATFRRGIVRHYAGYLGLDAATLLKLYEESSGDRATPTPISNTPAPNVHGRLGYLNFSMIGVTAVLLLVGFAWFYSAYFGNDNPQETPTQIISTPTQMDPAELNIPSPTPQPPTPTPSPEATNTPKPEPTPTDEPVVQETTAPDTTTDNSTVNAAPTDEAPVDFETPTPPATEGGIGIGVIANGNIFVSVTADGVEVFSGQMAAGDSTDIFRGDHITVFTSDDSLTAYTSLTSDYFTMGGSGETQWDFP